MAEVIGTVSGVVGIACATVQFAEGIRKLYVFCKDIQQAPEALCRATDELQMLSHILDSMAFQMQKNPAAMALRAHLPAILQVCRQGQCETLKLLADLQSRVSRKRGAFKAAMRQNDIRKSLESVERAKSSLLLAQAIFYGGYMQQSFDDIIERLKPLELTHISHSQQVSPTNQICAVAQFEPLNKPDMQPEDDDEDTFILPIHQRKRNLSTSSTCFRLQPLPWLLSHTWQIAVERSICGWNISFRVHRTLPQDSPFFLACREADLGQIQAMIGSNAASVFDRDPDGDTALHWLVRGFGGYDVQRYITVAKFLVSLGADVRATNDWHYSAIFYFPTSRAGLIHEAASRQLELSKVVTYSVDLDLEEITEEDILRSVSYLNSDSPSIIKSIQKNLLPSWIRISPMDRIQLLLASRSGILGTASAFRAWIIDDLANLPWSEATFHLRAKLILSILATMCHYASFPDSDCQQWREVLKDIALCNNNTCLDTWYASRNIRGIDVEGYEHYRFISLKWTPMRQMIRGYCWITPYTYDKVNEALQFAIRGLQLLGIDLLHFGRKESKLWDFCSEESSHGSAWIRLENNEVEEFSEGYMMGFTYGPNQADWHALWWTPMYEWAGEFWSMVEDRPLAVPGAYPTDD